MDALLLEYYQFKDLFEKLPNLINEKFEYDDSLLLTLLSFKTSPLFYSKNDKYDLYNKFNSNKFNDFIIECAISLSINNDYEKLLFLYGMIISDTTINYLRQYLEQIVPEYPINEAINMIDSIIADKNEINIKDSLLDKYPEAFNYYTYMDKLVHRPLVRIFSFFGSTNYFKRAYKKMKKFYKSKTKKKIFKIEKNETKYSDTYSTKIFNKDKNEFKLDDKIYKFEFNDLMDFINDKIYKKINALNAYLFDNYKDNFIKEFNILDDKKI